MLLATMSVIFWTFTTFFQAEILFMCREITSSETSTIKATKIVEKFKTCCRRAKKGSGARERQYNSTTNESESGLHELCWKRAAVEREKLKYAHHYMNRDSIFLNFRYDAKKNHTFIFPRKSTSHKQQCLTHICGSSKQGLVPTTNMTMAADCHDFFTNLFTLSRLR